jgi:hypothetical protein
MKTFKTVLLITGILVAGLAFNTVAQSTSALDHDEIYGAGKTIALHEGKAARKEYKREGKAMAKNNKREYKSRKHDHKDHKHEHKAAKRSFKNKDKSWKKSTR